MGTMHFFLPRRICAVSCGMLRPDRRKISGFFVLEVLLPSQRRIWFPRDAFVLRDDFVVLILGTPLPKLGHKLFFGRASLAQHSRTCQLRSAMHGAKTYWNFGWALPHLITPRLASCSRAGFLTSKLRNRDCTFPGLSGHRVSKAMDIALTVFEVWLFFQKFEGSV